MTIAFSFSVILLIIGIVVGFFVALILFLEKSNQQANKYLAGLVLICIGTLLHNFLIESTIYQQQQQLYFLPIIFSLGTGPLLYLYVRRLINIKKTTAIEVFAHLIPLLLQVLVYSYCFLENGERKYNLYIKVYEPFIKPIQNIGVYISIAIYVFLSFKQIANYKAQLNNFYSTSYQLALKWLSMLLYIFMGYYILLITFLIISTSFKIETNYFPSDFIRCCIIFAIAYFAIKQNNLIDIQHNIESLHNNKPEHDVAPVNTIPYEIAQKPKEINKELLQKIVSIVEEEQLYVNEQLTIADIGTKLGYSAKSISSTINNGLGKSFSLFINEYRIKLFIQKKASGKFNNLSIMGIAYDCGFNSKSTFNRIFKEITGASPKIHLIDSEQVPNNEI